MMVLKKDFEIRAFLVADVKTELKVAKNKRVCWKTISILTRDSDSKWAYITDQSKVNITVTCQNQI